MKKLHDLKKKSVGQHVFYANPLIFITFGAGDETRTRNLNLGKVALYH